MSRKGRWAERRNIGERKVALWLWENGTLAKKSGSLATGKSLLAREKRHLGIWDATLWQGDGMLLLVYLTKTIIGVI